jgi:hypothetical protein
MQCFTFRRKHMTGSQRILAIAIAGVMLIGGYAFGRMGETPRTNAEDAKTALTSESTVAPAQTTQATADSQAFYLSDYKTGYTEGFNSVKNGVSTMPITTAREGYNEGYKAGIADAVKTQEAPRSAVASTRFAQQEQVYRPVATQRRGPSKLKTALTIAAPAAIGAGIGAGVGGGKGAAVGALVGGGGGALYHLIKNKDR